MLRLAIYGSALGGGAGQIIEALQFQEQLKPVFILDRDTAAIGKTVFGVPVAGPTDELESRWLNKEFDQAIVAIGGDLIERKRVYDLMTALHIPMANVLAQGVSFGINTLIGQGNVILNSTYIGNNSTIGNNNYILNQCSVQHDTIIEDHNYFATNVTIGAKVRIGSFNRLGIKCIVETKAVIENEAVHKSGEIIYFKH